MTAYFRSYRFIASLSRLFFLLPGSQHDGPSCRTAPAVACLWGLTGGTAQKCQACIFCAAVSCIKASDMLKPRLPELEMRFRKRKNTFLTRFLAHNCLSYVSHETIFKPCSGQSRQGLWGLAYPPPCFGPWVQRISITVGDDCWNVCYVILWAPQLPSRESESAAGEPRPSLSWRHITVKSQRGFWIARLRGPRLHAGRQSIRII